MIKPVRVTESYRTTEYEIQAEYVDGELDDLGIWEVVDGETRALQLSASDAELFQVLHEITRKRGRDVD